MENKVSVSDSFKKSFYDKLKKDVSNHKYMIAVCLITIATFGFTLGNFSLGIDDFGIRYYMNFSADSYGNMIQQGRLLHVVLYYVTGLVNIVPFLNNFVSALLMALSGVLVTALLDLSCNFTMRLYEKILFFGLYISYPTVAFKFIYDLDVLVVAISYVAVTIGVVYAFSFIDSKKKKDAFISVVCTVIAIGSYETFIAFFGCLVILCLVFMSIHTNQTCKTAFSKGFKALAIVAVAVVAYYALVFLVQLITSNDAYPRQNIFTQDVPMYLALLGVIGKAIQPWLFFSHEFLVAFFVFVFLGVFYTVKTRKKHISLLFLLFFLCLLSVNIVQGTLYYRSCQTFCLFIAGTALLFMQIFTDKQCSKKVVMSLLALLLLWQIKDTNTWFYKDFVNHQKNAYAINRIATDLYSGYDVKNKPVCFVNRNYESYLMTWEPYRYQTEIGESSLMSSVWFLGDESSQATFTLFEYSGYTDLLIPSKEQAVSAKEYAKKMPQYPCDGYIKELDDKIIVNMGDKPYKVYTFEW